MLAVLQFSKKIHGFLKVRSLQLLISDKLKKIVVGLGVNEEITNKFYIWIQSWLDIVKQLLNVDL